jgi:hypothetical protein
MSILNEVTKTWNAPSRTFSPSGKGRLGVASRASSSPKIKENECCRAQGRIKNQKKVENNGRTARTIRNTFSSVDRSIKRLLRA